VGSSFSSEGATVLGAVKAKPALRAGLRSLRSLRALTAPALGGGGG